MSIFNLQQVYLSKKEENALDGKYGPHLSTAFKILIAIGEATEAEKLIPIKWAHVSGVNYNSLGDAGVDFITKFSKAKVSVFTTLNPMGYDRSKKQRISKTFKQKQTTIVRSYLEMGITPSFSCIPYEIYKLPRKHTRVSFAESNAAIMANSFFGLLTNKESGLSALASAITGKTPYSDLLNNKYRHSKTRVKLDLDLRTELDYGMLGYYAGKTVSNSCVSFGSHARRLNIIEAKSLSSALGTSGSCGMFTDEDTDLEHINFGKKEMESVRGELNTSENGDVIALGSPQLGLNELELVSTSLKGRKFSKPCMIYCPRAIYDKALRSGIAQRIERAGGNIICDSCTCLTPLITRAEYDSVITNSVKGSYYFNKFSQLPVCLKDLRSIMRDHLR
jgi:phosphomecalonate degydratase large subunit